MDDTEVFVLSDSSALSAMANIQGSADCGNSLKNIFVHAMVHGRQGAANGVTVLQDGTERRFSYVFEFKNTKANWIAHVYSYP